jgi:hypothetical protein
MPQTDGEPVFGTATIPMQLFMAPSLAVADLKDRPELLMQKLHQLTWHRPK